MAADDEFDICWVVGYDIGRGAGIVVCYGLVILEGIGGLVGHGSNMD